MSTETVTARLRPGATAAPLPRLLRAELRWMLARRRTLLTLAGLAVIPIVLGVGLSLSNDSGGGNGPMGGMDALLRGNGLVLPVVALMMLGNLLLPLVASMFAADAIAGEAAHGTLRGLLVAPVGRLRLFGVKTFGVAVASLVAVLVVTVVAAVTGELIFGGSGMVSFTGSTIGTAGAIGRIGLAVLYTTVQLWAIGAVALAISACTEHPLIVIAATLGGIIVFTVLNNISQLSVIHPLLITNGNNGQALSGLLNAPLEMSDYGQAMLVAGCYLVIGLSLTVLRMINPR